MAKNYLLTRSLSSSFSTFVSGSPWSACTNQMFVYFGQGVQLVPPGRAYIYILFPAPQFGRIYVLFICRILPAILEFPCNLRRIISSPFTSIAAQLTGTAYNERSSTPIALDATGEDCRCWDSTGQKTLLWKTKSIFLTYDIHWYWFRCNLKSQKVTCSLSETNNSFSKHLIWINSFPRCWWFAHVYSSCPLKKIHPFPTIHNDKRITQRSYPFNLNGQTEEYFLHTSRV